MSCLLPLMTINPIKNPEAAESTRIIMLTTELTRRLLFSDDSACLSAESFMLSASFDESGSALGSGRANALRRFS